ncbi:nuclear factor 7, brain-like [Hyperolius riggenbachi]|uniref:nuclear factor 7, brain-like n=1 Tax=Hyperolius riggenbachi TaxID=752182 RepID=UPI0035A323D9
MASALGDELICPICQDLFTEPVSLKCGHNFCQDCIGAVLDAQENSGGGFSCSECMEAYLERPLLEQNKKLSSIVDNIRSMEQEKTEILCVFCVDFPVAAVKGCLQCETTMCDKHLTAHNGRVDHVLVEPTCSRINKRCRIHKKPLEYYCFTDTACLCVSCCLVGSHKKHFVELLEVASEEKKEMLRFVLEQLQPVIGAVDARVQALRDYEKKSQEQADEEKKRVSDVFEDIVSKLRMKESKVLKEISSQEEQVLMSVSNLLQHLEKHREDINKELAHTEKLANMDDPVAVLQDKTYETHVPEEEEPHIFELDAFLISLLLHNSITDTLSDIGSQTLPVQEVTDLLLDAKSAHHFMTLSDDLKMASCSETSHNRRESPERFLQFCQVMSIKGFDSGRHYWEVEIGDVGDWDVGVCYPSIKRVGLDSGIGDNEKSWSFHKHESKLSVLHDSESHPLNLDSPCRKLGIHLDYEAGRLSFYQLGEPTRLLHTFTTPFTEPLHAAFYLFGGAWVKILH